MSGGAMVLVVDDELQIRRFLRVSLEAHNFRVLEAGAGQEALARVAQSRPDLILLDMGLPDMDGLTVLVRLREWTDTPVIILTVRDADRDKVRALDAGADDYVTKPFSTDELLARMRTALRHAQHNAEEAIFTSGRLTVDLARRLVAVDGQPVRLTPTEYALLRLMI